MAVDPGLRSPCHVTSEVTGKKKRSTERKSLYHVTPEFPADLNAKPWPRNLRSYGQGDRIFPPTRNSEVPGQNTPRNSEVPGQSTPRK